MCGTRAHSEHPLIDEPIWTLRACPIYNYRPSLSSVQVGNSNIVKRSPEVCRLVGTKLTMHTLWWGKSFGGGRALVGGELWWGESFGGGRALVGESFGGGGGGRELWWGKSFGGGRASNGGGRALVGGELWWGESFGGGRALVGGELWWGGGGGGGESFGGGRASNGGGRALVGIFFPCQSAYKPLWSSSRCLVGLFLMNEHTSLVFAIGTGTLSTAPCCS